MPLCHAVGERILRLAWPATTVIAINVIAKTVGGEASPLNVLTHRGNCLAATTAAAGPARLKPF
jgi:hypothetical protein